MNVAAADYKTRIIESIFDYEKKEDDVQRDPNC
jgi:hypothetical protein